MEIAITPTNGFIFMVSDLLEGWEGMTKDEIKEAAVQFIIDSDPDWVMDSLEWEAEIIG
jgi:hypothetical protein